MTDTLYFLLPLCGFSALALAMERHCEPALQRLPTPRQQRAWRLLGALCLGGSLLWALLGPQSLGLALVGFGSWLTPAALLVVALLTWRPRWLPTLGAMAALVLVGILLRLAGGL